MKIEARVLEYESSVHGERVGMSIDTSALAHIMSVLTDLYSDPELAVLREYSTNALDAHIEAGVQRPIEVTLPSPLSPFVRIRDYGDGLDAEDIRNVFSRYGTSTKRESDDVVGMLGLGCKSALSYADQFTLTGVKDGTRTEVLVSRDEDGSGTMTIVDASATDIASGTEIVVPAKSGHGFERKARDLFRFWTPGSVLVNGVRPERIDGLWLSDDLLLSADVDTDIIVQGNVPYPVPDELSSRRAFGYGMRHRTIRFVEIGSVSFTPSREALQLTKRTKAVLEALPAERASLVQSECGRMISEAANARDAIRIQGECRAVGFKGNATYKGREVPTTLDREPRDASGNRRHLDPAESTSESFLVAGSPYSKKNGAREWGTDFAIVAIFVGYESKLLTPAKREKIESYRESHGLAERGKIVLCERLSASERFWTEGIHVADWSIVDAIKLARAERPSILDGGRPRGSYSGRDSGVWTDSIQADEIDTSAPLYWVWGNSGAASQHPAIRQGMIPEDATVIALPANRVERFVRDFPSAITLDDAAREAAKRWTATVDADLVAAYVLRTSGRDAERLTGFDPAAILDPALRESVRLANVDTASIAKDVRRFDGFLPADFAKRAEGTSVLAPYPLLTLSSYGDLTRCKNETMIYLNASYIARTKDAEASTKGR